MARDMSARRRVQQYLRSHGAIDDPSGYATTALKEAIEYKGSAVGFIQMVAAMDRDGEIVREVRGKRTYRIALSESASGAQVAPRPRPEEPAAAHPTVEIDYDELARAIVREFFVQAGQAGDGKTATDRLRAERDEYALRLEIARLRLEGLLGERAEERGSLLRRLPLDD